MVNKSPKDFGCGTPSKYSKWPNFMAYKRGWSVHHVSDTWDDLPSRAFGALVVRWLEETPWIAAKTLFFGGTHAGQEWYRNIRLYWLFSTELDMKNPAIFPMESSVEAMLEPTLQTKGAGFDVFGSFDSGWKTYCWWLKSCTTKDDDYPIIYRVLTIPGGCLGFQPSTVGIRTHFLLGNGETRLVFLPGVGIKGSPKGNESYSNHPFWGAFAVSFREGNEFLPLKRGQDSKNWKDKGLPVHNHFFRGTWHVSF